jgi:hypothetical protein
MPITLTNLQASRPLHIPLSSGVTLRLSPGQTSGAMPDVEISDNPKVEKLAGQGLIDVRPSKPASSGRASAAKSAKGARTARSTTTAAKPATPGRRSRPRQAAPRATVDRSADQPSAGS